MNALYARVLQFRAGPNEHEFYACEAHKPDLERGDYSGLFFPTSDQPLRSVDVDDELECDYCREG